MVPTALWDTKSYIAVEQNELKTDPTSDEGSTGPGDG